MEAHPVGEGQIPVDKTKQGLKFWKGICKSWNLVDENLVLRIGNGWQVRFWLDLWVPNQGRLIDIARQ